MNEELEKKKEFFDECKDDLSKYYDVDLGGEYSAITLSDGTIFSNDYSFKMQSYYIKQYHKTLLDVGCGRGNQLEYWRAKGFCVEGCDFCKVALLECSRRMLPVTYVDFDSDSFSLPYADGSFDVVVTHQTLEHVKFPKRLVDEMYRVSSDLIMLCSPVGYSYYDVSHINFWKNTNELKDALLNKEWVYDIEFSIARPRDVVGINEKDSSVVFKSLNFLIVIYKRLHVSLVPSIKFVGEEKYHKINMEAFESLLLRSSDNGILGVL